MSDNKEMPEGTIQQTGTCIYCGQSMIMETVGTATQDQLNKWATEKCSCKEAKEAQERVKEKRTAEDNIEKLFRESFPEIEAIMKESLPYIDDESICKITIDNGYGVKGSISKTAKGAIKVEMATTHKRALEA